MLLFSLAYQDPPAPKVLETRVVEAAVFKSGLIYLTREATVPAGKGTYQLDVVPEALDGTFWYGSPDGLVIRDIRTRLSLEDDEKEAKAETILDYLTANVGKRVSVGVERQGSIEPLSGVIQNVGAGPGGFLVTFKLDSGKLRSVPSVAIVELDPAGLTAVTSRKVPNPRVLVTFDADANRSSRIRFVTLQLGGAWTGTYFVDITNPNQAKVEGKAQVATGGLKLENTELTAVAGFPNLNPQRKYDLAAGIGTLASYLQGNQQQYANLRPGPVDPFFLIPRLLQQRQFFQGQAMGQYGGGFGGGSFGGGGGAFDQIAYGPTDNSLIVDHGGQEQMPSDPNASRVESLYAYPLGRLSLDPGDRLTRLLFSQMTSYKNLFRWNASNSVVAQSILRLTNESKVPWTGGQTFIVKEGIPLAQVEMPYTPVGEKADLALGAAPDILGSVESSQTGPESFSLPEYPKHVFARTVQNNTLTLHNTRNQAVEVEVSYEITGTVLDSGGAKITDRKAGSDQWNVARTAQWVVQLRPGERRALQISSYRLTLTAIRP